MQTKLDKAFKIIVDISNRKVTIPQAISWYVTDENIAHLNCQIIDEVEDSIIDIQSYKLSMRVLTPSRILKEVNYTLSDVTNNIFTLTLPDELITEKGRHQCELSIEYLGDKLTSEPFNYNIIQSIANQLDSTISKDSHYPLVLELEDKLKEWNNILDEQVSKVIILNNDVTNAEKTRQANEAQRIADEAIRAEFYEGFNDRLDVVDSQLAHIECYYAYANGIISNSINDAKNNATILNDLLQKGNCYIEMEGIIYIDDKIVIPSNRELRGINKNVKLIQVTSNTDVINITGRMSSVKNITLSLQNIPTNITACIRVNGIEDMTSSGNIIEDVFMLGKAREYDFETDTHISTNSNSKCVGVYYDIEQSNSAIYFTTLKDCYVFGCEYALSIGHKEVTRGENSWITTINVYNLIAESCKYFGYVQGGGHDIQGSFQPWFSNMDYVLYIESDLSRYKIIPYDLTVFNVAHAMVFSNKSVDNDFELWGPRGAKSFEVLDLGVGNRQLNGHIRSPKLITFGYSGLDETTLQNKVSHSDFNIEVNGVQDNMLANAAHWAGVTSTITPSAGFISDIFNNDKIRECRFNGVNNNNPLILTLDLKANSDMSIITCSTIGLQFGQYMPKHIKIETEYNSERKVLYENDNEKQGEIILSRLYNLNVDKIIITCNECWLDEQVRINYLWATSASRVGRSFVQTKGGDIYGDLSVYNLTAKGNIKVTNSTTGIELSPIDTEFPYYYANGKCRASMLGSVVGETYKSFYGVNYAGATVVGLDGGTTMKFGVNALMTDYPFRLGLYTAGTRPSLGNTIYERGIIIYDDTLKKCLLWNGTQWVNLDGTALQ